MQRAPKQQCDEQVQIPSMVLVYILVADKESRQGIAILPYEYIMGQWKHERPARTEDTNAAIQFVDFLTVKNNYWCILVLIQACTINKCATTMLLALELLHLTLVYLRIAFQSTSSYIFYVFRICGMLTPRNPLQIDTTRPPTVSYLDIYAPQPEQSAYASCRWFVPSQVYNNFLPFKLMEYHRL